VNPPYRLDSPASSEASSKVRQKSVTSRAGAMPGSTNDEPAATVWEAPKNERPFAVELASSDNGELFT
jgi:hypothetical protein